MAPWLSRAWVRLNSFAMSITEENDDVPLHLVLKEEKDEVHIIEVDNGDNEMNSVDVFENCGVCRQKVAERNGKLLGCLHTFCDNCLSESEKARAADRTVDGKILCPVCRCLTPRTLLSSNHFVTTPDSSSSSPSASSKKCSCDDDVDGISYCLECSEWLCSDCVTAHKRVKLTKSHTITDEAPEVCDGIEYCENHPNEPLQLFCESCDMMTCRDCQLQHHKEHRYDFVADAAAKERKLLQLAFPELIQKKGNLIEFMQLGETRLKDLDHQEENLNHQIEMYFTEIFTLIKTKQNELQMQVRAVCGQRKRETSSMVNTSKKLLNAIRHSENFIDYIGDKSKTKGLLCARRLVKDYFNLILREPAPTEQNLRHCNTNIQFNHRGQQFVRGFAAQKLGDIVFDRNGPLISSASVQSRPRLPAQMMRPPYSQVPMPQQMHHQVLTHRSSPVLSPGPPRPHSTDSGTSSGSQPGLPLTPPTGPAVKRQRVSSGDVVDLLPFF